MAFNIGENIKKLRTEKGVTQERVAEHLKITYQSVSKWENNITAPDLYLIPAIAEYFEVSIDELFLPNMKSYKNKAARLQALYCFRHTKENFDKAESEYEKIIAENRADAEDFRSYGILNQFRSEDLIKKAEEILKKAIDMGSRPSEFQLIGILEKQGRQKENIEKYETAIERNPESAHYWYALAYSYSGYYGSGVNPAKSLEVCQKGLEKCPNDAMLLSLCGDTCRGLKRYDEALDYYKKSIEQNPDLGDSYYGMAFAYTDIKKYKEAIWAWEEVISLTKRLNMNEEEIKMQTEWPKQEIAKLQNYINSN